jgi:hypothetical protein
LLAEAWRCPLYLGEEMLNTHYWTVQNLEKKFLNEKWLNMNKEIAYRI